jgi:hypothetical protein
MFKVSGYSYHQIFDNVMDLDQIVRLAACMFAKGDISAVIWRQIFTAVQNGDNWKFYSASDNYDINIHFDSGYTREDGE